MRINEDFIKVKVDREYSLVPTDNDYKNGVFILNETAGIIYDLLNDGKSRDEIVAALCNEYDTDRQTAQDYTDEYISKLREAGILLDD